MTNKCSYCGGEVYAFLVPGILRNVAALDYTTYPICRVCFVKQRLEGLKIGEVHREHGHVIIGATRTVYTNNCISLKTFLPSIRKKLGYYDPPA